MYEYIAPQALAWVWYDGPWCGAHVIGSVVGCVSWFRLCAVVQHVIANRGDPDRTPVVPAWYDAGVVGACGWQPERQMPERRTHRSSRPLRAQDRSHFDTFWQCARGS